MGSGHRTVEAKEGTTTTVPGHMGPRQGKAQGTGGGGQSVGQRGSRVSRDSKLARQASGAVSQTGAKRTGPTGLGKHRTNGGTRPRFQPGHGKSFWGGTGGAGADLGRGTVPAADGSVGGQEEAGQDAGTARARGGGTPQTREGGGTRTPQRMQCCSPRHRRQCKLRCPGGHRCQQKTHHSNRTWPPIFLNCRTYYQDSNDTGHHG